MNESSSGAPGLEQVDFAENPEPRCACVLVLDNSPSMGEDDGAKIRELNAGRVAFRDDLLKDELAVKRVEVAQVSFGPVTTVQPFCAPDQMDVTEWHADGSGTPLGAAVLHGLQLARERVGVYKHLGIPYYRPWVVLITDGEPTDEIEATCAEVQQLEAANKVAFFAIGVDGAIMRILKRFSTQRAPLRLKNHNFRECFLWLSASMKSTSRSKPSDTVVPPSPQGWAKT